MVMASARPVFTVIGKWSSARSIGIGMSNVECDGSGSTLTQCLYDPTLCALDLPHVMLYGSRDCVSVFREGMRASCSHFKQQKSVKLPFRGP
ncbi:hypothetical protein RRG08_061373 [Elysia crispata]|uniref:Uncharacterized protein n=1 Tax=Elysia crispata TaxID=231223 RepID=A0AAE1AHG1_9GAST|nr:hypothetical protein RRG08_061373 [Elysia crispata]